MPDRTSSAAQIHELAANAEAAEAHTAFNQALAGKVKPVKDTAPTGGLDTWDF